MVYYGPDDRRCCSWELTFLIYKAVCENPDNMLQINIPDNYYSERKYVINTVVNDFLGLHYELKTAPNNENYKIILPDGKCIIIEDHFFSKIDESTGYLDVACIPEKILYGKNKYCPEIDVPIIFGTEQPVEMIQQPQENILCPIAIFASSFFMLSRWEEYVNTTRDEHDRFPATASIAYKNAFLNRPVVNEYVETFWNMLLALGYKDKKKARAFRMFLSHDIDMTYEDLFLSPYHALKRSAGDFLKRKKPGQALQNFNRWMSVRSGNLTVDRYNTFDFIMTESEKRSLQSSFYFLPHGSSDLIVDYSLSDTVLKDILLTIDDRGHEIGLHGHYETYMNETALCEDAMILKETLRESGINQEIKGGRQHYLRWSTPYTFKNWEAAGFEYDSTLSYADHPGFRCGICYEFQPFDFLERRSFNIIERPLVAMECTVTADRYMGKGFGTEALDIFKAFKNTCRKYHGDFTLLWHNSELVTREQRELYTNIINC